MSLAASNTLWRPPQPAWTSARADLTHATFERLQTIAARFPRAVIASSVQAEDAVLVALNAALNAPLGVATIDTGRLPAETHDALRALEQRYRLAIEVVEPSAETVLTWEQENGKDAFYHSLSLRQSCCALRKTAPLKRMLQDRPAWVTGQRRAQAQSRTSIAHEGFDEQFQVMKFNPLADWSDDDVWAYVRAFDVPVSALYARGYASIGCDPCTRAVRSDEDIRAGRWWWETASAKECGLHLVPQTPSGGVAP